MKRYAVFLVILGGLEFESYNFDADYEQVLKEDRPDIETPLFDIYESDYIREEKS